MFSTTYDLPPYAVCHNLSQTFEKDGLKLQALVCLSLFPHSDFLGQRSEPQLRLYNP
jgi:hypothetical protein